MCQHLQAGARNVDDRLPLGNALVVSNDWIVPVERGRIDGDELQLDSLDVNLPLQLINVEVQEGIAHTIVAESYGHQIFHVIKFARYESINYNFRNQPIFLPSLLLLMRGRVVIRIVRSVSIPKRYEHKIVHKCKHQFK